MNEAQLIKLAEALSLNKITHRNANIMACCPFHHENNPSFGISLHKSGHPWGCFSCGERGGSVVSLVSKLMMLPLPDAREFCEKFGVVEVPDLNDGQQKPLEKPTFSITEYFDSFLDNDERLSYHGLSPATCRKAKIGYDSISRRYLVPWILKGKIIGVTSHAGPDSESKNTKMIPLDGFNHKAALYLPPPPLIAIKKFKPIFVLVEAPADALRLTEYGVCNVAAIGGASITSTQVRLLRLLTNLPIFGMFDPDLAGKAGTLKLSKAFPDRQVFFSRLTRADPADSTKAEVHSALRNATLIL